MCMCLLLTLFRYWWGGGGGGGRGLLLLINDHHQILRQFKLDTPLDGILIAAQGVRRVIIKFCCIKLMVVRPNKIEY